MKRSSTCLNVLTWIFGLLLLSGLIATTVRADAYVPPANNRISFNFNYDWLFGGKKDITGAAVSALNDTAWKPVSLPHTYDDNKFREWCATSNDSAQETGPYYGKAWYRKHFTIDSAYSGRKIILEFEGIGRVANFYINGTWVGLHENGVAPYGLDITNQVNFGVDNVIAVQVNNDERYKTVTYAGVELPYGQPFNPNFGGLNRDVTLHICDLAHLTYPLYRDLGTVGTYNYVTNIDTLAKTGNVTVQAEVKNEYLTAQTISCSSVVVDAGGNPLLTLTGSQQVIAPGAKGVFNLTGGMSGIHFWSPDYPYIYQIYTTVKIGGVTVDVGKTPLGIRKYSFSSTYGLQVNGHPIYLNGYAPRTSMEWPGVGTPVDWMNEFDFKLMKENNANFVRPMHIAPRKVQVEAADKFGIVMVCPAANNEGDETDVNKWQERLDIMRDVTIYFRNNPSVLFYEACNQILSAQHMTDMLNVRLQWDPSGGRLAGLRSNDTNTTQGIREFSSTMDGAGNDLYAPLWDAEYARGEAPRRVWDNYTPMLNSKRWNGMDSNPAPAAGTPGDTIHKYLTGGYFSIASDYHQALGLNSGVSDFIGDYLYVISSATGNPTHAYFRLQNSEDMVLQNLAKYYARYQRSVFVQTPETNVSKGVNVGGAKIIWSDSVTDGRMHDLEVTRVSGAVDGVRLPKETFYGLQVAHNSNPQVHVVGHWNYPVGTVKTVYVAANTALVKLQTFDTNGTLLHDYGYGTKNFFPTSILPTGGDQVNNYVFQFTNVAWQPGMIKATGYTSGGTQVAVQQKSTAGGPVALRLSPVPGPSGQFMADGSDVTMFDVEVVDANGNRCPTYEDKVSFTCSGEGVLLGGYNSGVRYSTNVNNNGIVNPSSYSFNVEAGINRVLVRSTRTTGTFTLNVSGTNTYTGTALTPASASLVSIAVPNPNGLSTIWPQKYTVPLGAEPAPVKEGVAPPPPKPAQPPAPATSIVDFAYSGANTDAAVVSSVQAGQRVYMDSTGIVFGSLPAYLTGAEYIRPYLGDAGESSSTDQYQFNLSRFSYVYQLIDAANGMPAHENNERYQWQQLPGQVTVNGRPMNVFKSRLMAPYENCYFATNGHEVANFDPNGNMYLVFVQWAETSLQKPSQVIVAGSAEGGNPIANVIDGIATTRWSASNGTYPQWIKIDLGQKSRIGGYQFNWYNNATRNYQYQIELSDDDVTYNLSLDMRLNTAFGVNEYRIPVSGANAGRYVKVTVSGGGGWASIYEMAINGVAPGSAAPPAPGALTATAGGGRVSLGWGASSNATSYAVKRATVSGGPYTTIATPTASSYMDSSVTLGATYYYVVSAVNATGESANSNEAGTATTTQPAAPVALTATPGSGQIGLAWSASGGATGYQVKRSIVSGGPYTTIATPATTSYMDTGLANGVTCYYVVSATNATGESASSNEANATTIMVSAANCAGPALGRFAADWGFSGGTTNSKTNTVNISGVTNPAPMAVYQTYRLGAFGYTMGGFTPGTNCNVRLHFAETYFTAANSRLFNVAINGTSVLTNFDIFAVSGAKFMANIQEFSTAVNAGGQVVVQFSNVKDNALCCGIEILQALSPAPTGLAATSGSGQVALAWNTSSGATSYKIKRAAASGGPYTGIGTSTSGNFVDPGVTNGTVCYYVVSALNGGGESPDSSEASAMPLSPLQNWRQAHFGTIDPNDPLAGDTATPMHDGISNLMKYALGLDPAKSSTTGLPGPATSGTFLTLTFNRQRIATDVTYRVEATGNLASWAEIWNSASVPYDGGDNPSRNVTVFDTVPMPAAPGGHRFMRLKVTRP
ncbi:MAG: malectin domain-containing carbohydrate-binding protein [Luteolibacter sp.]|uniref:malectin domain-containing carbohydrate-binding protein n=1 Tax=Luteolibacter sp. TaxID=1962973 RepID=UPI003262EF2F